MCVCVCVCVCVTLNELLINKLCWFYCAIWSEGGREGEKEREKRKVYVQ